MLTPHRPSTWPILVYASLDSTSDEARRLVTSGKEKPPLVVTAGRQTAGRGRGTNRWWSNGGSLLFTLVFDPKTLGITPAQEPRLALVSALAVIDSLPGIEGLTIRWPNDVVAGKLKICGILPEKFNGTDGHCWMSLGIGVNVSTNFEDAPAEVRSFATSAVALGYEATCDQVLDCCLKAFRLQTKLLSENSEAQSARWNALNALRHENVRISQGMHIVEGVVQDIDAEGALLVATAQGVEAIHGGQLIHDR